MKRTRGKPHYFDNRLHFTDDVKKNVDAAIQRVFEKGKASLIIVDGLQGEGKTTLAAQIGQYITQTRKQAFLLEVQYSRGGKQFQERLAQCYVKKLPSLVYDEAGDFDRKSAVTKYNKDLNQVFQQFRTFKIIVICSLPHFKILDSDLFTNGIPRMLFHCVSRNSQYGKIKIYSLKRMIQMMYLMKRKNIPPNEVYRKVYPNAIGFFKDFEPEMSKQLDVLSTTEKFRFLMEKQNKLTQEQLGEKLGRSKVWVGKMIKQKKLKESLVHKKKKFYDIKVFDKLDEAIRKGEGVK